MVEHRLTVETRQTCRCHVRDIDGIRIRSVQHCLATDIKTNPATSKSGAVSRHFSEGTPPERHSAPWALSSARRGAAACRASQSSHFSSDFGWMTLKGGTSNLRVDDVVDGAERTDRPFLDAQGRNGPAKRTRSVASRPR